MRSAQVIDYGCPSGVWLCCTQGNPSGLPLLNFVMAEKKPTTQSQSLAEGVDKELTCAICLSRYNQPKLLPCLHSYCKGCLEDMFEKSREKKSIACPQCKVEHVLPPQGIEGFTTFFTINNLLELLKIHEVNEEKPKCTSGLDEDFAVARCLTCSDYLCEGCLKIHQKQRLTRNHAIKTLEEIKQSDKKTGAQSLHKRQHCQEHEDELLKLYCKTCKKVICRDCALVTHREHNYAFVREVRADVQKRLEELISKVQAKEVEFQNHQKNADNLLKIAKEAIKSSEMKINTAFDRIIAAFEARRAQLLADARTVHESEVKQISQESESLSLSLLRLSGSIQFTRQLVDNGDDVEVMAVCDQTEQTLVSLTNLAWDAGMLKPSLLRPEFESIEENVSKCGKILHALQPSDIDLSNVPTKVAVERKCSFEVCLSEEVSERGYGATSEITISQPKTWVMIPVKKIEKDFNSWLVSFTPHNTGEHKVMVQIDGTVSVSRVINVVEAKYMYDEADDMDENGYDFESDPDSSQPVENASSKKESESDQDAEEPSQSDVQSASSRHVSKKTASAAKAQVYKTRKQRCVKVNTNTGHSRKGSYRKR